MNNVLIILLSWCSGMMAPAQPLPEADTKETVSFTLNISQLKSPSSTVYVGFYTIEDGFPKQGQHQFRKVITPNGTEISQTWTDIPEGEYAIAVYQDLDENDHLETNGFGLPQEPYGFSTNFKASMVRIPNFKKCSISISKENNEQSIAMIY